MPWRSPFSAVFFNPIPPRRSKPFWPITKAVILIEALKTAQELTVKNAEVRLSYLVEGDIYLRQGNLEAAREAYEKALKASKGTDVQKADALIGLGRLASLQNQNQMMPCSITNRPPRQHPTTAGDIFPRPCCSTNRVMPSSYLGLLEKAQAHESQDSALAAITNRYPQAGGARPGRKKAAKNRSTGPGPSGKHGSAPPGRSQTTAGRPNR